MGRWFQFRLATVFVAVAVCAISVDYFRRRQPLLELAKRHAEEANSHASSASPTTAWMISPLSPVPTPEEWSQLRKRETQLAENHRRLALKFRWAACLPWLPIPREAADIEFHFFTLDPTSLPQPSK
jgi:hypothetical protein